MKRILYYGFTKEEYENCQPLIDESNVKNVSTLTVILFVAELIASILSGFVSIMSKFHGIEIFFTVVTLVLLILNRKRAVPPFIQVYGYMLLLYAYGILIAIPAAEEKAILFPVIIILLPMLYVDRPVRMSIFMLLVTAVFCVFCFQFKNPEIAKVDIYNTVAFCLIAIVTQYYVNKKVVNGFISRIENENLSNQLKKEASTDLMTGLYNRNYFIKEVFHFFEECEVQKDQGYLVIMDLDQFKKINDTYGHHRGDEVIVKVADILKQHLHGDEYAARLGGDEYIFLIANRFHKRGVEEISDTILKEIHSIALSENYYASGSIGITKITDSAIGFDKMYQEADEALYKAKKKGGNRIEYANS